MFRKKTPGTLPETLRREIAAYIEKHLIVVCHAATFAMPLANGAAPHKEVKDKQERKFTVSVQPTDALSLEEILRQADAGFSETLLREIDKTGKKDSEIYKKANISKQHFSKIRNDPEYRPKKPTAVALAVALQLDLEQTKDLIGRAGYTLNNNSKFDLIVRYFIENSIYDIIQINIALHDFDQPLLGA